MSGGYAILRPRHFLLDVLASIAAYSDRKHHQHPDKPRWGLVGAWCVTKQSAILAWHAKTMTRLGWPAPVATMCRRTLNYHLAALERDGYIDREQRHRRHPSGRRAGKLDLRPSLYKFTALGRLWIKRRIDRAPIPLGRLAVQEVAQSDLHNEVRLSKSLFGSVDKSPTDRAGKPTKKSAAARRPVARLTSRAVRRPAKALVRKGAEPGAERVKSSPARRSGKRKAKAKAKALRRS